MAGPALAGGAVSAHAQRLTATELAAGVTAVAARHGFYGAELGVGRRPGGQGRFTLAAAAGDYDGRTGMRLAASAQFLLKPAERSGSSPYGGFGIALAGVAAERASGYLTAVVGVESAPGRATGWYAELGLAGGVKLAAGRRWRRLPAWWGR